MPQEFHRGPVCVDYSLMGRQMKERGPSYQCHKSYFENMKKSKNSIVIIENVCEYSEGLIRRELGAHWDLVSVRMDPRNLGLPCCRSRLFVICWKPKEVRWASPFRLECFVSYLLAQVAMTASDYFYKDLPRAKLTPSAVP